MLGRLPQRAIAVLLIVAAGLFVIGLTVEDGTETHSDDGTAQAGEHDEATESDEATEAEAAEPSTSEAERSESDEDHERLLGVDIESPVLVTAAVIASLLLAGLVWRRRDRRLLVVIAVFSAGFAVVDATEVAHQLDEDHTGLALLAGLITALHAAAAALSLHQAATTADAARGTVTS